MPLLAGAHEAFAAAGREMEQQRGIDWFITFCNELALRLPLSLIMAFAVFALTGGVGAFLSRLNSMSVAAQAARHDIDLGVVSNPNRTEQATRRVSGVRSFQLGRVA
jgi:hypothetical protein